MELSDLGFDLWFEAHAGTLLMAGQSIARVTAVDRGAFLVRNEGGEISAELSGRFRFSVQSGIDLPCVGDWVCVQYYASGQPGHHSCGLSEKDVPASQGSRQNRGLPDDRGKHRCRLDRPVLSLRFQHTVGSTGTWLWQAKVTFNPLSS